MLAISAVLAFSPLHPGIICPLRAATGVPCPFCGMTTSVKAMLHADPGGAWAANPGGIAAVLVAATLVVWRPRALRVPLVPIVVALAAMWVFQLTRFSVL